MFIIGMNISVCNDKPVHQPDPPVELEDFTVSPTSVSLMLEGMPDSQQITTTVQPEDTPDVTFTWSSGNNAVAAVSSTGTVTAKGVGVTQIAVTANNRIRKYVQVTVVRNPLTKVNEHTIGGFTIPTYYIPGRDDDLTSLKNTDLTFPAHTDGRKNTMADFIGANHIWPGYTLTAPDCLNDGGERMLELGSTTIKTYLVNY